MDGVDRRSLLALGLGALLGACRAGTPASTAPSPARRSSRPSPPRTTAPETAPAPPIHAWRPDPNDVQPAAKVAAVRAVEAQAGSRGSLLEVLDAQYGGLLPDAACVLVVCRRWASASGRWTLSGGSTYDVRLVRSFGGWRVTAVHPSRPGRPGVRLSAAARHVLAEPRIDLPPASRADVLSGTVHDSVLTAMLALARTYRIGVSVVRSGHPRYVFGTSRLSDHPLGRAFDTWWIDGQTVVDRRTPRRLVAGYMEAAAAAGSDNVGGPYLLGSAPQFFSDPTHHDHVHAGFAA